MTDKKNNASLRSRFKAHMYDLKLEWRLSGLLKRHERAQRMAAYGLLSECWSAGLQESTVVQKFDAYERLPGTYPISYLRAMLLSKETRAPETQKAAIW